MNIVMITGSAHKNGTTALLAEEFIKGAEEAGHSVYRFDAAYKNVHPCIACEKCHNTDTGCAFQDDMAELNPVLAAANVVVLVTPIYYYGMNAQLRTVIDRFYATDAALHGRKKAILMTAMADDSMESAAGANASFRSMAKYLEWEVAGIIRGTDYPKQAFRLGKSL